MAKFRVVMSNYQRTEIVEGKDLATVVSNFKKQIAEHNKTVLATTKNKNFFNAILSIEEVTE